VTKRIVDIPVTDRPREKLQKYGAKALSDLELLAILLGSGTKKYDVMLLSKRMMKIIDEKGTHLNLEDLLEIKGIGVAKASTLIAAIEFVRRRIKPEGLKIKKPADVLPLIQHYSYRHQEHFLSISINGANEVIAARVVTIGLVNQSQIHPREIFADIIADRATSVIIAHNHPSGSLKPSKEDITITKKIKDSAQLLGIGLLDHIIFTPKGYYSFLENHQL